MIIKTSELEGAEWRRVPSFSRYEASSSGYIRRAGYNGFKGDWHKPRLLSHKIDRYGYVKVKVSGQWRGAHRLVCEAFCGSSDLPQVNHLNGKKDDNRAENLEWCTASENAKHACETGLWDRRGGVNSRSFKGWVQAYNGEVGLMLRGNLDLIASGFDPSTVTKCINGSRSHSKGFSFSRVTAELGETVDVPEELVG